MWWSRCGAIFENGRDGLALADIRGGNNGGESMTHDKRGADRYACLPVLTRTTVEADGSVSLVHRVFCPGQTATLSLEHCRACVRCESIDGEGADAWLSCEPPDSDANAESVAGELVRRELTAVASDVPARFVVALVVGSETQAEVAVVDDTGRLVGAVTEAAVARAAGIELVMVRRVALEDVRARLRDRTTGSIMQPAVIVRESETAHDAALQLAARHGRWAHVVNSEGRPIGVLRDVDAMRASRRPPPNK